MIRFRLALVALVVSSTFVAACGSDGGGARVFFVTPTDGATVVSPVAVEMAVDGFVLEPAASGVNEGRGHLHIIIDRPCVEPRLTVPPDEQHLHFGRGQTTATLDLGPGDHFLCLQAADGSHTALPYTDTIEITVR